MPVAAALLALAYVGGGIAAEGDHPGVLLALHVALMLTAFAGFTVAAGLSGLFLWHERRLKRRQATILRLRVPPLDALERLSTRAVAVSLLALTIGIGLGLVSYAIDGGSFDLAMAVTTAAWGMYGGFLVLRRAGGLHGRRAAYLNLVGLALVAVTLTVTHFA
jgi:ABC-type uncharacterized transport system permease subunit